MRNTKVNKVTSLVTILHIYVEAEFMNMWLNADRNISDGDRRLKRRVFLKLTLNKNNFATVVLFSV